MLGGRAGHRCTCCRGEMLMLVWVMVMVMARVRREHVGERVGGLGEDVASLGAGATAHVGELMVVVVVVEVGVLGAKHLDGHVWIEYS